MPVLQENNMQLTRRITLLVLLAVCAYGTWVLGAQRQSELPQAVRQVLQLTDPATNSRIVARVVGTSITEGAVVTRQLIVESSSPNLGSSESYQVALDQLIEEAALLEIANAERMTVRVSDVMDFIENMQALAETSIETRDVFAAAAAQFGLSEKDFATDERVIQIYQRGMILSHMRQLVTDKLPAEKRADPDARKLAVDEYISASGVRIEVFK
jgi:hypothetical protein